MPDSDDDLLRQAERDLAELYPTPEAWERSYPLLDPPDDPEKRAQYDDLRDMYPEREDQTSVNALQKARFEKAIQKATVSREVSHHNPLPVTQDRVRDSIARATQERAQDVMKAREYAASMRDPLHQRSVGRVSPTNGLPPMDKSRQSVQDSAPKKVDLDRD